MSSGGFGRPKEGGRRGGREGEMVEGLSRERRREGGREGEEGLTSRLRFWIPRRVVAGVPTTT